ncbi:hypothetical protein F4694_000808 [Bacillus niacini]|uniref:LXG domain-containing protein n=1 Tax=Neobacillus niacini TaxID=86668 RepID=A0A852T9K1_9BACI|nr:hypothetical protein [Neobacillus niacini]NYE04064.1 hypothetical protein [Neobacillus niacini]
MNRWAVFLWKNQLKELFGAWIQAIGTVTAAVGSTPSLNDDTQESLNLWGNVLQGTGNALFADAQEGLTLENLETKSKQLAIPLL